MADLLNFDERFKERGYGFDIVFLFDEYDHPIATLFNGKELITFNEVTALHSNQLWKNKRLSSIPVHSRGII